MTYSINYPNTTTSNTLVWTSTGTTTSPTWTTSPYTISPTITVNDGTQNSLQVKGKAQFEEDVEVFGDIKIQNKSLKDQLDKIEERLAILHPNIELEKRWEELRNLRQQYMDLEREIIEKEKVWDILKK